jgi:DNA-binding NtrC family response regulator
MAEKPELLLIDDELFILDSLKLLFKRDYTVFTAESGEKGIETLQKHPNIKVVISDQRMPGLLGHETLREIKRLSPHTVRILLTGYSDLEAILQSVNSGEVFRYINKPWDSDRLSQVVQLGFEINHRLESLEREAAVKKTQPAHHDGPNFAPAASRSILFVEHNSEAAQQLVNTFSSQYQCAGVATTDEALKELAKRHISVVVSNVDFPDADPIDFLSAISHEYPNTVTLIYTEQRDADLAIRAINELNVYRYLVKPTDDAKLPGILEAAYNTSLARAEQKQGNLLHIGKEIAPEKNEVSTLRKKVEASPYLQKLRALRKAS